MGCCAAFGLMAGSWCGAWEAFVGPLGFGVGGPPGVLAAGEAAETGVETTELEREAAE